MNTIEDGDRRKGERKGPFSTDSETGFYAGRAKKKKERARLENGSVISI